ncbi:MAG: hypothetical protein ABIJ05_04500 [Patescibacteria group bacterium]
MAERIFPKESENVFYFLLQMRPKAVVGKLDTLITALEELQVTTYQPFKVYGGGKKGQDVINMFISADSRNPIPAELQVQYGGENLLVFMISPKEVEAFSKQKASEDQHSVNRVLLK